MICHTGGAKVLQALTEVLDPAIAGMEDSWSVLGDCGNMSAASVMFVEAAGVERERPTFAK